MNAKEARKLTDENNGPDNHGERLAAHARHCIHRAAKAGECKISNPFQGLRDAHSKMDEQVAYAKLEQDGYSVIKLGDTNVTISW